MHSSLATSSAVRLMQSCCPFLGALLWVSHGIVTKHHVLACWFKGAAHLLSLTYPSGSFLTPWVLHHSSISTCAILCTACTWLRIALGVMMVVLTNSFSGMRVTASLSCSPLSTPGSHDSMSGAAWIFLGTCLKMRLKSCRSENHHATCRLTFLGDFQWSKLAWSVRIVTGSSIL